MNKYFNDAVEEVFSKIRDAISIPDQDERNSQCMALALKALWRSGWVEVGIPTSTPTKFRIVIQHNPPIYVEGEIGETSIKPIFVGLFYLEGPLGNRTKRAYILNSEMKGVLMEFAEIVLRNTLTPRKAFEMARRLPSRNHLLESIIAQDAECALDYAIEILCVRFKVRRFEAAEPTFLKHPTEGVGYAIAVLRGPFPELEPHIADDPHLALRYAKHALKMAFKAGEASIARCPLLALEYARDVLHGAFPAAEPGIANDPQLEIALAYARDALHGPFPAAEPRLAQNAHLALQYARDVLHGAFPAAEPVLATNPQTARIYAEIIGRPFTLAEPIIASNPHEAFYYAKNVLHGPFPMGEKAIARKPKLMKMYEQIKGGSHDHEN